jgi:hypothetical protein
VLKLKSPILTLRSNVYIFEKNINSGVVAESYVQRFAVLKLKSTILTLRSNVYIFEKNINSGVVAESYVQPKKLKK